MASNLGSDKTVAETVGPFTEILSRASDIVAANTPRDLLPDTLLLTLVIAIVIWLVRRAYGSKGADGKARKARLFSFLLPKDIYTHVSARVDFGLWVVERFLHPLWAVGFLLTLTPLTEQFVIASLQNGFGSGPSLQVNYAWMLLYSLFSLLCYDFVFFLTHFTVHKVPALWAIHKIHHSAEVLTPLTRYREHFVAGPIWAIGGAVSYGFAAGIFAYLFDGSIAAATLLNISFFALLFGFNGSFRHYHVQFNYPVWLSKWLHSPAMHHVHHSYLEKHWDKNFAAVTSIWDRIFRTLYVPEKDEYTPWGLGPETQGEYRSLCQNLTGPFRDWAAMLSRKSPRNSDQSTENIDFPE